MNVIIKTNGEIIQAEPINGKDFKLEELKNVVNGYIELVHLHDEQGHYMVINEEGKLMGLPYNAKATYIYRNHTGRNDNIVGNVLICETSKIL